MEASSSILCLHSSFSSLRLPWKLPLTSFSFPLPTLTLSLPSTSPPFPRLCSLSTLQSRSGFVLRAAVDVITLKEESETTQDPNSDLNLAKRKLYVVNLPWTYPSTSIRDMFAECGPVTQIEMIKDNRGRFKGYAFVTMETPEAAQAAIDKLNLSEISERVIKVEYAKALKPQSSVPIDAVRETPHKLYVSNLQWKVRSNNLRDFFLPDFNPVSARVVFESAPRRSAGYGFVSFATREEANNAIAALNGKELMGRSIILKFSEVKSKESGGEADAESDLNVLSNDQPNEVSE
ncbi:hypothetical protein V2J09_004741 [Rumex salicifolius]